MNHHLAADFGAPITIYYCKAGLATGMTVRVRAGKQAYACKGVEFHANAAGFTATMIQGNSTGKAKASGARCVLEVTHGLVTLLGPVEFLK